MSVLGKMPLYLETTGSTPSFVIGEHTGAAVINDGRSRPLFIRGCSAQNVRVLLHVNNSNPLLLDDSPERAEAEAAGGKVAFDGMEVNL